MSHFSAVKPVNIPSFSGQNVAVHDVLSTWFMCITLMPFADAPSPAVTVAIVSMVKNAHIIQTKNAKGSKAPQNISMTPPMCRAYGGYAWIVCI